MTGDPIMAWSDKLNKRVCIGVIAVELRDGLSSPSLVQREKPWAKEGYATGSLPSQKEMKVPNASDAYQQARQKCSCGRVKARGRGLCHRCKQQQRRIGRRAA